MQLQIGIKHIGLHAKYLFAVQLMLTLISLGVNFVGITKDKVKVRLAGIPGVDYRSELNGRGDRFGSETIHLIVVM